jgi:hypothetical protein
MGAGSTRPSALSFELISDISDPDRLSDPGLILAPFAELWPDH